MQYNAVVASVPVTIIERALDVFHKLVGKDRKSEKPISRLGRSSLDYFRNSECPKGSLKKKLLTCKS